MNLNASEVFVSLQHTHNTYILRVYVILLDVLSHLGLSSTNHLLYP